MANEITKSLRFSGWANAVIATLYLPIPVAYCVSGEWWKAAWWAAIFVAFAVLSVVSFRDARRMRSMFGERPRVLHDGETVVLETPMHMSPESAARVREEWARHVKGTRAVVLTGGMRVAAVKGPK